MEHDDIDRLYQGPLDAFTDARNALAKSSRRAEVKTLQKPSLPAWAVNQLYWHHRPVVDRLIEAAEALRAQHRRTLAGERADLREVEQAHREALRDAVTAAKEVLAKDEHPVTPATLGAIRDTLQALPSPEANGRLARPLTPGGLEALAGVVMGGRPTPTVVARRAPEPKKDDDSAAAKLRHDREAEKAAKERAARRKVAEAALAKAREGLERAEAAVEKAEQDLANRVAERHAARAALKNAQRELEESSFGR